MARTVKNGLDYFPLDTKLNYKWELLEAKFGLEGFAIAIKLLQEIYKDGYILKIDDDILLLFARRNIIDINKLKQVIDFCINKGLFNKEIYEKYNSLTSELLQKNYFLAAKRRKSIEIVKEYLLVKDEFFIDNKFKTIILVNIKGENVDNNLQIRLDKEKEKERDKDKDSEKINVSKNILKFWNSLPELIDCSSNPVDVLKTIKPLLNNFDESTLIESIRNYNEILSDKEYFYNQRWNLKQFFTKENGFETFLNNGSNYVSYEKRIIKSNNSGSKKKLSELEEFKKKHGI